MKLLADENIEPAMVGDLRSNGFDVLYIRETRRGIADSAVLELAGNESRVLLTADLDFGELALRSGKLHAGVIILRLDPLSLKERIRRVLETLKKLPSPPIGMLWVIEPARTRGPRK
jgi:predicted nuclease of predicted toxin-antitoxin system